MANRFEKNPRGTLFALLGALGLCLAMGGFFLVKAVRDEVHRGVERYIILRENRPQSDLAKRPNAALLAVAEGLEDRPYRLRVDENGFVMPSKIHAAADLNLVFLGGSTTECHYMEEEHRFPYRTGRLLEQRLGLTVNAYNGGCAGDNSMHLLFLLLAKTLCLKPQAVVYMECINDTNFLLALGDYWTPHPSRGLVYDKEYGPLKTFIIRQLMGRKTEGESGPDGSEALPQRRHEANIAELRANLRQNVELFVYICRQKGIVPVLMTQFNRFVDEPDAKTLQSMERVFTSMRLDYATYVQAYRSGNQVIRDVAEAQDVALVDLERLVPQDKKYLYDVVHLNDAGGVLVSDLLAERLPEVLRDAGLLEPRAKP